jgi:hypothetical protein
MILDINTFLSNKQALTATAVSTNVLDLGPLYSGPAGANLGRNIGVGQRLFIIALLTSALVGAGAAVTVTLDTAADAAFSVTVASAVQTLGTFAALSPAGTKLVAGLQPGAINQQFLRANYTVAGGTLTGGNVSTFMTNDIDAFQAYTTAFLVD